jgi:23S rRNA (cytidine1920-2'-O)/16S rRNA (cytidine1409-2'-O)-methyltransferase
MTKKERLDAYVQKKKGLTSLNKAQSLIMQGFVFINDQKVTKAGFLINTNDLIDIRYQPKKYVSRGGIKLEGAFTLFKLSAKNKYCLDIGLSTGGFTDYLLQQDAKHVIGIDVAYGKVDLSIRNHPKTTIIERCNARSIQLPQSPALIELVVMDVSFISVHKILPNILKQVSPTAQFIILIKPQFEGEKSLIPKGGVIKDSEVITTILDQTTHRLTDIGLTKIKQCASPIKGTKGNQEYFFWLSPTNRGIKRG